MNKGLINEELIRIQEMMGVTKKGLLIESFLPGLVRILDDLIKIGAKSADEVGAALLKSTPQKKVLNQLKGYLDNIAFGAKTGDDFVIRVNLKNILNMPKVGDEIAAKIARDVMDDAAPDGVKTALNKRAQSLFAQGMDSGAIRKDLIEAIKSTFQDMPKIVDNLTSKLDDFVTIPKDVVTKAITRDELFAKLATMNPQLRNLMQDINFSSFFNKEIDNLIKAGAKTEDEMVAILNKKIQNKVNGSTWKKIKELENAFVENVVPGDRKTMKIIYAILIIGALGGAGSIMKDGFSWLMTGKVNGKDAGEIIDDIITDEEAGEEEGKIGGDPSAGCPGESSLRDYLSSNTGGTLASFDEATCSGVDDIAEVWTWDSNTNTWK